MDLDYDPAKGTSNVAKHGVEFEQVRNFDFETAWIYEDDRNSYGETRWLAIGLLNERLHVLCFVETLTGIRVISFRKANTREVKRYDAFKAQSDAR